MLPLICQVLNTIRICLVPGKGKYRAIGIAELFYRLPVGVVARSICKLLGPQLAPLQLGTNIRDRTLLAARIQQHFYDEGVTAIMLDIKRVQFDPAGCNLPGTVRKGTPTTPHVPPRL